MPVLPTMLWLRPRAALIGLQAAAIAWVFGCAAPPAGDLLGEQVSGGSLLLGTQRFRSAAPWRVDWSPASGRMSAELRKRHLTTEQAFETILVEEFDSFSPAHVPGWRTIGSPVLEAVHLDGLEGIELRSPGAPGGTCGLERPLDPALLAGREVRLDLRLACPSFRLLEALSGIRLSLLALDWSGQAHVVRLPITAEVSPGWETQRWRLRFDPTVGPVSLRIHATRPGARIALDRISLVGGEPPPGRSGAPTTGPATPLAGPAVNLITGGDFETGQPCFYASGAARWPNGEERPTALGWEFDKDGAVGDHSLRLRLEDQTARIGFGPLDLNRPPVRDLAVGASGSDWHLGFHARADRPLAVTVSLRSPSRTIGRETFQLSTRWRRFAHRFSAPARTRDERIDLRSVELVFDFASDAVREPCYCWLDAVMLTDAFIELPYVRPAPIEVGLFCPAADPVDLSNLLDEKDPMVFCVRLAAGEKSGDQQAGSGGPAVQAGAARLAVDVLDAWDRLVWTRTTTPIIPPAGGIDEMVSLPLPRGYYRVLATLWNRAPGESSIISHASMPVAVLSTDDPVPWGNRFGLSTDGANVSLRTTHLGAGWVRIDLAARRLQVAPGLWDTSAWQRLMSRCGQGHIEVVVGLTLPGSSPACESFLDQWLTGSVMSLLGVVVSPPVISIQPTRDYLDRLAVVRDRLSVRGHSAQVVMDLSAWVGPAGPDIPEADPGDVFAISCTEGALPEASEPLLEAIAEDRRAEVPLWDLGVPTRIGGSAGERFLQPAPGQQTSAGPVRRLDDPIDPVLSASRMVRSLLIRWLAGAEMVCSEAVALAPMRSIHDDHRRRLHEKDLSPRVAVVAFDLMAELLNDATLTRWIDYPGGSRVLYFEKDDGRAVAVAWRPFGLQPTRLGFADLPSPLEVLDCVGSPVHTVIEAGRRVVEVNEIVQYLAVPAELRGALQQSLDTIQFMPAPATQPAR